MKIEELKQRKLELGYSNRQLSEESGVPIGTIAKIFGSATKAPRRETLLALEAVLAPNQTTQTNDVFPTSRDTTAQLRETAFLYRADLPKGAPQKQQGEYTLEDYYALPEDQRAELIDGVLYAMTSPTSEHQTIALQVAHQLLSHMNDLEADTNQCEVYIAPFDVQLDCDDRTMVEPDVIVLCDKKKDINRCIFGAPDFVLEVISPSTKRRDVLIKLNKYWHAGVREYWIVDPHERTVTVYDFEHDELQILYTFEDQIPVHISNGKCTIDFQSIRMRLDRNASARKE